MWKFIRALLFEYFLDVPLSVQNMNDAQDFGLNDVEDENVFEAFHRPES